MNLAHRIAVEVWKTVRYLATGRTVSRRQEKARTYHLARLKAGPGDE